MNKNQKEKQLVIVKDDGTEEIADILFTYEANDKKYVVFQFLTNDEVSAAIFTDDEAGSGILTGIETDAEWDMIDEVLSAYFDDLEKAEAEEQDDDQ